MACCCGQPDATCATCRCNPLTAPYEWGLNFNLAAGGVCFVARGFVEDVGYKDSVNESISVTLQGATTNISPSCNLAGTSLNLPGNRFLTAQATISTRGTQCVLTVGIALNLRRVITFTCPDGTPALTREFLTSLSASGEVVFAPFACAGSSFEVPMLGSFLGRTGVVQEEYICPPYPPFIVTQNIWNYTGPCSLVSVSFTATITT
jgi:hypothetical protein